MTCFAYFAGFQEACEERRKEIFSFFCAFICGIFLLIEYLKPDGRPVPGAQMNNEYSIEYWVKEDLGNYVVAHPIGRGGEVRIYEKPIPKNILFLRYRP